MNTEVPPDEWAICPAPHLGDVYFTCALAEAFLQKHGGSRLKIIMPERFWRMPALFPTARIVPVDPQSLKQPVSEDNPLRPGEPFLLRPLQHLDKVLYRDGECDFPFTKAYHDLLDLPFPSFATPEISDEIRASARRHFEEADLPAGHTVLLFPATFSLTALPIALWCDIARSLSDLGFTVATNVPDGVGLCVPGTRRASIPVEELIPISELAGRVVTARSGVCDVLSSANTDLRIVYQKEELEWRPVEGLSLQWDLGPCGLEDHATYFRMGSSESAEHLVQRIVA